MLMNRLSVALRFAVKLLTGCLLLSEVCSSAQAEIVTVVYTGTLNTSYDFTGMFGAPNASVTGDAVSVTYVFNTSIGIVNSSPTSSSAQGGSNYGAASPAELATVTINGISQYIVGAYSAQIIGGNQTLPGVEQFHSAADNGVGADSSPGGKGRRTFQCFECDRPDPIKTDQTMAWLKGELHPPK
jgi:hypothetical protein